VRFGLPYWFRWALGLLLRHVKTCRTRPHREPRFKGYIRARSWYAPCLILLGNWYLRWLSTGVKILPTRVWLDWECRLHTELSGLIAQRAGRRRLLLPWIEGQPLAEILASRTQDPAHKDQAVRLAAAALIQAHQHHLLWPDGVSRPLSHGDATARNVLCDVAGGRAAWIDFETLHDPRRTAAWRHADDLRALVWSAAETVTPDAYEAICAAVIDCVSDAAVLGELARVAAGEQPSVYHLAQGTLSPAQHRRLCSVLAAVADRRSQSLHASCLLGMDDGMTYETVKVVNPFASP
jgi:hypothetical protein